MSRNPKDTCSSCKSWDPIETSEAIGRCRKNPPVFHRDKDIGKMTTGSWPTTLSIDWCDRYLWRGGKING